MIGLIGLDFHSASMDVLGKLTFTGEQLARALDSLTNEPEIDEAAIVCTCNRTEVYVAARDLDPAMSLVQRYLTQTYDRSRRADTTSARPTLTLAESRQVLATCTYHREEMHAARHLLRVAAGLESMVVGEAQILGQVKDALAAAEIAGSVDEELRPLFTEAIKVGKRARAETSLGQADLSVAALAMRVAERVLDELAGKRIVLIGAGRTAQLCARIAQERGAGRIVVANRTAPTAADLAAKLGGETIALSEVSSALRDADLLVSATAAPHVVVTAPMVADSVSSRNAPLVIVDLALPPDVDDEVRGLPGVLLLRLDDLRELDPQSTATEQREHSGDAVLVHADQIVEDGVRTLMRVRTLRLAVPGIAALRRHVDRSEQAELARVLAQLDHLAPEDRAAVERFGRRLVDKMFHHLVSRIRSLAEDDGVAPEVTMQVLARLFADPDGSTPEPASTATEHTKVQRS